jgi:peptidylprolyl isomerase
MRRSLTALLVALAALAAACGSDQPIRETSESTSSTESETTTPSGDLASTDLDDVEVSGDAGEQPTLTFDKPFGVEETTTRVLTEGDGDPIEVNAVTSFDFLFVNGRDGTELGNSYESEPAELVFEDSLMAGLFKGLDGVTAGSRVLIAIAPADGLGADETTGVLETDTLLFFAEVHDVRMPLQRAEGAAVSPVDGLPTVALADDGAPTITVPGGEPPADLIAQPLIEGTGDVVAAGQTITVHYTGVLWNDGTVFDSSWESGSPATFDIGTGAVIAGWDEGLVGRKVGSQVLLVVPPAKGYPEGSPDGSITATDTIVFVVDILDAG